MDAMTAMYAAAMALVERKYSYDTRCLMTAEYFLGQPRTKADEESLAQAIQDAVEDWFAAREQKEPT